jgi:DNA-binding XRE family transcriptional regulator
VVDWQAESVEQLAIAGLECRGAPQAAKQIQPQTGAVKAFGQALREIRENKEVSQERLALDSGLDRTYISLIERGINSPSIRVLWDCHPRPEDRQSRSRLPWRHPAGNRLGFLRLAPG